MSDAYSYDAPANTTVNVRIDPSALTGSAAPAAAAAPTQGIASDADVNAYLANPNPRPAAPYGGAATAEREGGLTTGFLRGLAQQPAGVLSAAPVIGHYFDRQHLGKYLHVDNPSTLESFGEFLGGTLPWAFFPAGRVLGAIGEFAPSLARLAARYATTPVRQAIGRGAFTGGVAGAAQEPTSDSPFARVDQAILGAGAGAVLGGIGGRLAGRAAGEAGGAAGEAGGRPPEPPPRGPVDPGDPPEPRPTDPPESVAATRGEPGYEEGPERPRPPPEDPEAGVRPGPPSPAAKPELAFTPQQIEDNYRAQRWIRMIDPMRRHRVQKAGALDELPTTTIGLQGKIGPSGEKLTRAQAQETQKFLQERGTFVKKPGQRAGYEVAADPVIPEEPVYVPDIIRRAETAAAPQAATAPAAAPTAPAAPPGQPAAPRQPGIPRNQRTEAAPVFQRMARGFVPPEGTSPDEHEVVRSFIGKVLEGQARHNGNINAYFSSPEFNGATSDFLSMISASGKDFYKRWRTIRLMVRGLQWAVGQGPFPASEATRAAIGHWGERLAGPVGAQMGRSMQ